MNDPSILTAIGTTLLTIGGGAAATIKFLFARLEASVNERINHMQAHIGKLEGHVDDCEKDRNLLHAERIKLHMEIAAIHQRQVSLKQQVDQMTPEAG